MRDKGCIIDGDTVTKGEKVGLGEHERRKTAGEKRAVLADGGTQSAEVHDCIVGAGEQADDTASAVADATQFLDCKEELPALAVAALVPVIVADLASTKKNPFCGDDNGKSKKCLECVQDGNEGGEESEDEYGGGRECRAGGQGPKS